jgi:hypothetical protein
MPRSVRRAALRVLGILVFAAVACTDLSEVPYSEVTEKDFRPSIESLIGPAYIPLRALWMGWYGNLDFQEETADALLTPVRPNGWYDGGTYIRLHEHRWSATQGQPGSLWGNAFSGINAINRIVYQIDSGVVAVPATVKPGLLAELQALRAYYYSLLLDNFGNVPIVTNFKSTEVPQQSTRQQVYDFVVDQLTTAMPSLSAETGTSTYGRMTQWAAKGLLARVYLNAEVSTGTPQYDKVILLTQEIIASAKYHLESRYRAPFARNNDQSAELIWAVPYDAVNGTESCFHMKTLKPELRFVFNMQAQPWGGSASNPQFIETYDPADTRKADTWLMGRQFTPDSAYGYNFVEYVPRIDSTAFNNGFPVWKYEIYAGETGASDVDYPIMRYAEVLMMRAEALLRTGQPDAAAALVSEVRQRAFATTDSSKATVTGAQLLQGSSYNYGWYDTSGVVLTGRGGTPVVNGGADVQYGRFLDELGWEFAAEGHRRQQLIRFGVFTKKMWFNHVPNGDYRTIFAIPEGAMSTNPNLTQNPGY